VDLTFRFRHKLPRLQQNARRDFVRVLSEEHVEELAILWRIRKQHLGSPDHRLVDLVRLDERIDAHADAIVSVGEAAKPLLTAGLESGDPSEVFASAHVILRTADRRGLSLLQDRVALAEESTETLEGWRDALVHAPGAAWQSLVETFPQTSDHARAILDEVEAFHCADNSAGSVPMQLFASDSVAARAYAWRAVAHGREAAESAWTDGFEDSSQEVRRLALEAAAWQRRSGLLEYLRDASRRTVLPDEVALHVLAAVATGGDVDRVLDALHSLRTKHRLRVTSVLGHPSSIPGLIDLLTDDNARTAVAAGAALTRITGWDVDSERKVSVPPEGAPPGDEIAAAFDEVLVLPDVARAEELWKADRKRFEAGTRWSRGVEVATMPERDIRCVDLESLKACCLRGRVFGGPTWKPARLEAFPQPRI
jgi:uncharacterized protein (TIGR02270 family)